MRRNSNLGEIKISCLVAAVTKKAVTQLVWNTVYKAALYDLILIWVYSIPFEPLTSSALTTTEVSKFQVVTVKLGKQSPFKG